MMSLSSEVWREMWPKYFSVRHECIVGPGTNNKHVFGNGHTTRVVLSKDKTKKIRYENVSNCSHSILYTQPLAPDYITLENYL